MNYSFDKTGIKVNKLGDKCCYCWDGDVYCIAREDWQEIIFGYYNDENYDAWSVGIKRNGEKSGRSGYFYQVLKTNLAIAILDDIEKEVQSKDQRDKISLIKKIVLEEIEPGTHDIHELFRGFNN